MAPCSRCLYYAAISPFDYEQYLEQDHFVILNFSIQ